MFDIFPRNLLLRVVITADGDCSHEIKSCLLLGRKFMTNLDSILKSRIRKLWHIYTMEYYSAIFIIQLTSIHYY